MLNKKNPQKKNLLIFALLSAGLTHVHAQQQQVKGAVQNEKGEFLPGVSVKAIQVNGGPSVTTSTNTQGLFHFQNLVEHAGYRFVFSAVGFQSDTLSGYVIEARKPLSLSVKLQQSAVKLDEVVIGYGRVSRKDLTSSISTIKAEDANVGVFTSPAQMLQGKVAGLTISSNNSNPNATPSISLRGASTLRSGEAMEPYYVIDGVPGASLALVAPDDIASIDVLRDASATAIYGSKAANGVIIVTTKRGKSGQTNINYNGYLAIDKVAKHYEMMNATQYRSYVNDNGFSMEPTDDLGADTDWQRAVERTGISNNHNISILGGAEKTQYSISLNTIKNNGVIKGTDMGRQIARAFLQTKALNDRLTASFNVNASITKQNDVLALDQGLSVYDAMYYYLPVSPVRNTDGSWFEKADRSQYANPLSLIEENTNFSKTKVLQAHAKLGYEILPGLTYNIDLSLQNRQFNNAQYYSMFSMAARGQNGKSIRAAVEDERKVTEMNLSYEKTFAGKHKVAALAGYSWEENNNNDGFQLTTSDYYSDDLSYYNPGMANVVDLLGFGNYYLSTLRMISVYGRVNYAYNNKYLLQATVRRDGSSAFGTNNRWATFPSVSAAWRLSEESFIRETGIFDDLKLRAGFGVSGNSLGFDTFTAQSVRGASSKFFDYVSADGQVSPLRTLMVLRNSNPNLKWETTSMINLGLDFGFLKNRLTGSLEVYKKKTSDLIYDYQVSKSKYIYPTLTANVGEIENKGIELSLNANAIDKEDFKWNTGLVLSHNTNKVVSIANEQFTQDYIELSDLGGAGQTNVFQQRLTPGAPIGQFYTWEWAGYNDEGVSVFYTRDEKTGERTGETTTTPQKKDQAVTGSPQPKLTLGWNNSFSYKNFSLTAMFQGAFGQKIMNATRARHSNVVGNAGQKNVLASVVETERMTDINAHYLSDRYLENGSYLRLAYVTLAYTIPMKNIPIKNLRVYATMNNVFVLTKYKGIDPEVGLGGLTPGIDNRQTYPRTRTFMFGLNFNL
ncbi:SusC/RagA family TonB-linked outer membrane protein [Sphingobacterium multivorum]|uniref:Outer membrane cobalamin receptor protein n=1 Tax=Sphingobacterium multivorum TaxID=28454 RepID=A0A654DJY0_SPHMU|nr:TonB-dependent receptor [Sphingobacterium multivorum]HBI89517.1 SusC/RagA family TonB-linked outer membrane protein [Sphingobacterium sp.]QQT45537.1 TonB-dependent receptor [Sphingobacterium multivorum]QQT61818.1 TonB-dependent receptor [Sphingobacterium multivorum]SUJ26632.1 Outer membrane cobalamin receptor protein [Sphingobacterium multivorum]VXD04752.1 Outer membrane cobalamin receptor protein [Sphingobacterium multivorum]